MLFSRKDKDSSPDQDAAKKLGLSKTIYGMGVAARDSLVTFLTATAALLPVMYFGQGKSRIIDWLADAPDKLGIWAKKSVGPEKFGKIGKTIGLSAAAGFLISHVANLPGLVYGRKAVQKAEDTFNNEVDANVALHKENTKLTEALKHKELELAGLKSGNKASFVARVSAQEPTPGNSMNL